jgi:hypothetical protein
MKKILLVVLVLGLMGASVGFYFYTKTPDDIRDLKEDFTLSAIDLVQAFNENEEAANQKFLNKVIVVSGTIADIKTDSNPTLQLEGTDLLSGVTCSFYEDEVAKLKTLKAGDQVILKGKCTGKLMDVVLNNCRIQNPKNHD